MYNLLDGLRIIEASSFVASPTAGLYCAQFGAEVIRVDQVGGGPDYHRWPVTGANDSLYWENLNRAKKSVALDHAAMAATLDAAGIVHSAYRTMLDAAHDPRLVGNNPMFTDFEANPSGFSYPAAGAFGSIPQMERGDARAAPRNGQHSEEILSNMLGLSSGEIARLIDSGTLGDDL